jgi:TolA-binding protein
MYDFLKKPVLGKGINRMMNDRRLSKKTRHLMLVSLVIFFWGCAHQKAWDKANALGTVGAYENYILQFPDGKHVPQALEHIEKLSYQSALHADKPSVLRNFINNYPQGQYTQEIRGRLEKLLFDAAVHKSAKDQFISLISEFPQSEYAEKAKIEIEKIDYAQAVKSRSIDSLKDYLGQYPETTHLEDIQKLMTALKKEQAVDNLITASAAGDENRVKKIISSGLDINSKSTKGLTPLMAAVSKGHNVSFGMRMENFSVTGEVVDGLPAPEETPADIKLIKYLLSSGVSMKTENQGNRALILAVERGYVRISKLLIDAGADVNTTLGSGAPVIQLALAVGHFEMVKMLVKAGAQVDKSFLRAGFIEGGDKSGYEKSLKYLKRILKMYGLSSKLKILQPLAVICTHAQRNPAFRNTIDMAV